jgi:predicted oxidoreductase (fatty acid repression mutant protein)
MKKEFYNAIADRRSYYGISKEQVISDQSIIELTEQALKHAPSAFNSQSARVVLLLGESHDRLWDITKEILKEQLGADRFPPTEEKLNSFRAGYGTVLYFEDSSVVEALQSQFPTYHDNFPVWSQQSSGMLQYVIWTALELEGFGVSLQHYNELIEARVKSEWKIADEWKLIAQMPFGKPVAEPGEKQYQPTESRLLVL